MASLARSLLALAVLALLQAACAFSLGSNPSNDASFGGPHRACKTYMFGSKTDNSDSSMTYELPRIYLHKFVNHVVLHDPRDNEVGTDVIGEEIRACDRSSEAPDVNLSIPGSFRYVKVVARGNVHQPHIELRVTRYRQVAGRPSSDSSESDE